MRPTRFLLVGCGGITDAHLPAFREHPGQLRLAAVCDPSENARARVLGALPASDAIAAYAEVAEALERERDRLDAVLIATPHFLHFPQACACLEAGLPVLVEKPLGLRLDELRHLRELAARHRVPVVAGQNRRFDARVQWLRQWIAAAPGHFGETQSFDLFAFQNIRSWIATKPDPEADFWILDKARAGGGVVMSLLIHLLDLVRALSGLDFATATARARFDPPFKNGAESSCSGLLTLSNGAVGTFHANYLAPRHPRAGEGLTLFGTHGLVRQAGRWEFASAADGGPPPWGQPDEGLTVVPVEATSPFQSFGAQLQSFVSALAADTVPPNHLEEHFNTLAVIEAIYASMESDGQPVAVARR